jgi:cell wall-associated NlpC family hydrolase
VTRCTQRFAVALVLGGLLASVGSTVPVASASPLGDAKTRAAELRHQVDTLRQKAEIATEDYDAAYAELGQAVNDHLTAQKALQDAQQQSGADDSTSARRARALYISGGATALYASALSSGNIADVTHQIHQVRSVLGADASSVQRANTNVARSQAAEKRLAQSAAAATTLQKKVADKGDEVRALLSQTEGLLASADKQVRDLAEQQRKAAEAAAAEAAARQLATAALNVGTLPDVPASERAAAALDFARQQLGKPYLWGATGPDSFDCSGLTGAAYAAAGLRLPRTSREQWYAGPHVDLAQLAPGDLLFWASDTSNPATIHHVALYAGEGLMVAAPHSGDVVKVQPIYLNGFIGAVRPGSVTSVTPAR